jgi:hypothetical protein
MEFIAYLFCTDESGFGPLGCDAVTLGEGSPNLTWKSTERSPLSGDHKDLLRTQVTEISLPWCSVNCPTCCFYFWSSKSLMSATKDGLSVGFRHVWAHGEEWGRPAESLSNCMRDKGPVGKGLTLSERKSRCMSLDWRGEENQCSANDKCPSA